MVVFVFFYLPLETGDFFPFIRIDRGTLIKWLSLMADG